MKKRPALFRPALYRLVLILAFLPALLPLAARAQTAEIIPADLRATVEGSVELVEAASGALFPGLATAPINLLLLTDGREFYISREAPGENYGFEWTGERMDGRDVYARGNQYDLGFMATFPAVGVPTIVMGTPENTGRTPLGWALTLMHERFHVYQVSLPGFYEGVDALDLAGGDESGMWMLDYDFPYEDTDIGALFYDMTSALATAQLSLVDVAFGGSAALTEAVEDYLAKKAAFREALSAADYRYFSFVVWREGLARYVQAMTPVTLMRSHFTSDAFGGNMRAGLTLEAVRIEETSRTNLFSPNALRDIKREAFYAVGHFEGLLLDEVAPGWRDKYAQDMFSTDSYFEN